MKIAKTSLLLIAFALLSPPVSAGERYRHHDEDRHYGEVLNGRLHTYDFDGGVGYAGGYYDSSYSGGYGGGYAMSSGSTALYGYGASSTSFSASAGTSAFAFSMNGR